MIVPRQLPRTGTLIVRDERIVQASEGVLAVLGHASAELLGTHYLDLVAPEHREMVAERHQRRVRGEPVPSDYEVMVLRRDGTRATVEIHVDVHGGEAVIQVRDVSLELERRSRLLELAAVGASIQRERTEAGVMARLRAALPGLGIMPALMRPNRDGVTIEWAALPAPIEEACVVASGQPLAGYVGRTSAFSRRVMDEGAIFSDDWGADAAQFVPQPEGARARALAQAFHLQRAMGLRIDERNGARFYLVLASSWFRREDLAAARLFATQLAAALDAAQTIAELARRLSDLTAVHALSERIFASPPGDAGALLREGCRAVAGALGCRGAAGFLVEENGAVLRGVGLRWAPLASPHARVPVARDGLAGEAIRIGTPAWSPDLRRDRRSLLASRRCSLPAVLAVPVVSRSAVRGVLFAAAPAGRVFSDAERSLAMALAGELAVGLENAELYAAAQEQVRHLSLLGEMGRTLASSLDLGQVIEAGAEAACHLLSAERAFIVLHEIDGRLATGSGRRVHERMEAHRPALEERGLGARALRERRVLAIEDLATTPDEHPARWSLETRSVLAAPLLIRGEPLGVLFAESSRAGRFGEAEQERAAAVAHQLAVAIENARLYAEARVRLSELSTVIDVARVVSSTLDLEEVLTAGAEHLKATLRAAACTILLEDLERRQLRRAAHRGPPIGPESLALEGGSLASEALRARAPVIGSFDAGAGEVALLVVPLHVRDNMVGVALVSAERPERGFSPGELSRAMAIASQLAVAVDNARLYQETRRRAEELALLHEVGRSLVATLDIEEVLQAGARNLARIVDAPAALLALTTADGTALEFRAAWGGARGILGQRLALDPLGGLGQEAFTGRDPLIVEDVLTDPRIPDSLRPALQARSLLAVPLLVRDHYVGSAVILEELSPRRFTAAEVDRAAAVANQLAVAVENARLYADLRRSYAKLAQAQRQLIEQERLAALGELSAVVAHEVRNPLGVIFNSLGSLRRLLKPEGDARVLLDIVGEEADRLNHIVGDLLDFTRPITPVLRPEPLEKVMEEAVAASLSECLAAVEVESDIAPDLPPVPMDARLVRQALLNVAANAIQAMPRGGRLTVRIRADRGSVVAELEDTGPGIPPEIRARIFEPFFTTKATGSGLGLAVVKRIVDGHGGEISVSPRSGGGTTVQLRFPVQRGAQAVESGGRIG